MESSSSCKRAKAPGSISQVAHCLVDGCDADLSLCRDYHRRHKVCEAHSKTPKVTIAGREQRFCQQCSRFHSLVEFDEGKRSCRKRLDGHNRRRRKPQPDSLSRNPGLVFSSQQGSARLLSFSSPQIFPSSVVSSSWAPAPSPAPVVVKSENDMHVSHYNNNNISTTLLPGSSSSGFNEDHGAHSLLSSGPAAFNHHLQQHYACAGLGGHYPNNFGDDQQSKAVVSAGADSHASDASTLHFPQMFQQSSTSGSPHHQTLSFMWE